MFDFRVRPNLAPPIGKTLFLFFYGFYSIFFPTHKQAIFFVHTFINRCHFLGSMLIICLNINLVHNIHQILFKRCALTRGSIPHFESGLIKNKTKIKCLADGVIWNLGQLSIECDFGII